jgi:hypothetical protein
LGIFGLKVNHLATLIWLPHVVLMSALSKHSWHWQHQEQKKNICEKTFRPKSSFIKSIPCRSGFEAVPDSGDVAGEDRRRGPAPDGRRRRRTRTRALLRLRRIEDPSHRVLADFVHRL